MAGFLLRFFGKPEPRKTVFQDKYANEIFTDPFSYARMFAEGQSIVHNRIYYRVLGARMLFGNQIVVIEKIAAGEAEKKGVE